MSIDKKKSPVFEVAARQRAGGPRNRGSVHGGDRNIICSSQRHHCSYSLHLMGSWYGVWGTGYVVRGTGMGYGVWGTWYEVRGPW
jgi:hypothetical protein